MSLLNYSGLPLRIEGVVYKPLGVAKFRYAEGQAYIINCPLLPDGSFVIVDPSSVDEYMTPASASATVHGLKWDAKDKVFDCEIKRHAYLNKLKTVYGSRIRPRSPNMKLKSTARLYRSAMLSGEYGHECELDDDLTTPNETETEMFSDKLKGNLELYIGDAWSTLTDHWRYMQCLHNISSRRFSIFIERMSTGCTCESIVRMHSDIAVAENRFYKYFKMKHRIPVAQDTKTVELK